MKRALVYVFLFALSIGLSGCLVVETKEYSYELKDGNSGSGKIKYINIMRSDDSGVTIEEDYNDLMNNYLNGSKPEDEMLGVKNVKKRLFEEDNHLCGEITFDFDDISLLKFFSYKGKVWVYNISSAGNSIFGGSESYFSSNGTFGGESVPMIFWDGNTKEFNFKTTISQGEKPNISLLGIWKEKGK